MAKNSLASPVDLVVIGGSAGSLDVILRMLPPLSHNLSFPLIIVLHRKSTFDSSLSDLFATRTSLTVKEAEEKEYLRPGVIYLAPADYHLLVEKNLTLSLDYSEKVNYSRPSIDVTFQTAADALEGNLAGILLSGANADGALGLKTIHSAGGITAAQNPGSAEMPYMPNQALALSAVDYILNVDEIAYFVNKLSDSKTKFHSE